MPFKGSLRAKILAWSFVPAAIILVAVALVSLYAHQRTTEDLVIQRDAELTALSAEMLGSELAGYLDPLSEHYLAAFDGVIMYKADGTVVAAEPDEFRWLVDSALRRVLRSGERALSDVMVEGPNGEPLLMAVMPLTGPGGESKGGIAGVLRLGPRSDSLLYQSIEKARRGPTMALYVVDGQGRVIYHSDPQHIGASFLAQPAVRWALAGRSGALRTRDLAGRDVVASYAPVPGTSWTLVREESWALLMQPSRRYQQFLLLLLALGVVVPTLIVTVGVRRITRPIAELIAGAQQVAGGNFDQRIAASGGGELEELAGQFNRMAAQLQESYASLEQKVAERTRQLAALNAIAAEVSRSLDLGEILNDALDRVLEVAGLECGLAFRPDEQAGALVLAAWRGAADPHPAGRPLPAGAVTVQPVAAYPAGPLAGWLAANGSEAAVSVPLLATDRPVGAIDVGLPAGREASPELLSLLGAIGHQVGMAVENALLYEQAQQLAVVKERNRLARDLHDSVTQALYGVTLCVEAANRQLSAGDAARAARHLAEVEAITQEAMREMRLLIFELRPLALKEVGLAGVLRARLEAVEERAGLRTELEVAGDVRLPPRVEEGLYRVAQEALNNVLKHAHGSRVRVRLAANDGIAVLEVEDDGVGFDAAARASAGFGLRGMASRVEQMGGRFLVCHGEGHGTLVRVEVSQS